MLIVTGSITAQREHLPRVLELSLEHVNRSRTWSRAVSSIPSTANVEAENRLVFLEHWADADALRVHFAVPASIAFVREAASLAEEAPTLEIYEAQPVSIYTHNPEQVGRDCACRAVR